MKPFCTLEHEKSMNRSLYSLALLTLWGATANAQGLIGIRNGDGDLVNGTVVFVQTDITASVSDVGLYCELLEGTEPEQINVRRYELWPVEGSGNYFCWGVCYLSVPSGTNSTWVSQHYLQLTPGSPVNNFHAYYEPNNTPGTSRFRFVWFRTSDPYASDSSWVDIDFGASVGVEERARALNSMKVMPNPALASDMKISLDLDAGVRGASLVIYNTLGSRVQEHNLAAGVSTVTLRREDLMPGIYFGNVEVDGRVLESRRLVIGSR